MTGPQSPAAAGGDHLRAGHADREQVIETLKDAFVQGRLTREELGARAGRALAARTRADLAALTTDIPAGPAVAGPARPVAPARRWPLARAAAGSGSCLALAAVAVSLINLADPGPTPGVIPKPFGDLFFLMALAAIIAALVILARGVAASVEQRRSRRQLPPRPGPDGRSLRDGRPGDGGHGRNSPRSARQPGPGAELRARQWRQPQRHAAGFRVAGPAVQLVVPGGVRVPDGGGPGVPAMAAMAARMPAFRRR